MGSGGERPAGFFCSLGAQTFNYRHQQLVLVYASKGIKHITMEHFSFSCSINKIEAFFTLDTFL